MRKLFSQFFFERRVLFFPWRVLNASFALQLYLRHLTGSRLRVLNSAREKISCEYFRHFEKNLCYYAARSALKISFNNCNRARHKGRIPQYTESSINE